MPSTVPDQIISNDSLPVLKLTNGASLNGIHHLEMHLIELNRSTLNQYVKDIYDLDSCSECPFTDEEIEALNGSQEMLVYLPANWTMKQLCEHFGIQSNVCFEYETLIFNVMTKEDQWFICSKKPYPELLYQNANKAKEIYEQEGLLGFDMRRYLAFCGTFNYINGFFPDNQYWTFLLSGKYDGSGISIVGFDKHGILNHHGWMKNFKAKFCGNRYVILAPRVEINDETEKISRGHRGDKGVNGLESSCG